MKRRAPMKRALRNIRRSDPASPALKKRAPLKRVGKVASREKADITIFRETVVGRAHGWCERCDCQTGGLEAHHLVRRSRCVGWPLRHSPGVNGAAVCRACHAWLTSDPMDVCGPLEGDSKRAHALFGAWRAKNGKRPSFSG